MNQDLSAQREAVLAVAGRLMEARKLYKQGVTHLEQNEYAAGGECISQAAEMGESAAQDHLGFLQENGFFGDPDPETAAFWYRKSADQCLPNGQFHLAACYHAGNGVEQDWEEAARLFELAANQGHPEAAQCLQMLREYGVNDIVPEEIDDEDDISMESSTPEISRMLALPPELDDPTVTDAPAAYQPLAMKNDAAAQLKLGLAYHIGRSAPANPKLAYFWVMRSMLSGSYDAAQYLQYLLTNIPPEDQGTMQMAVFQWIPGHAVPQF